LSIANKFLFFSLNSDLRCTRFNFISAWYEDSFICSASNFLNSWCSTSTGSKIEIKESTFDCRSNNLFTEILSSCNSFSILNALCTNGVLLQKSQLGSN